MICNKLLKAGRSQKTGKQYCTSHKSLCFSYPVEVKTSKGVYSYQRIRHNDRRIKDHNMDAPTRYATEYLNPNEVRTYSFMDYEDDQLFYPPKHCVQRKAVSIVVYDFMRIPKELEPEFLKLHSSELTLSQKEIKWLLNLREVKGQVEIKEFYENILNNVKANRLITFGEKAVKEADRIRRSEYFRGNIMYCFDKFGMLDQIVKERDRKRKIRGHSEKTYNSPRPLLTENR